MDPKSYDLYCEDCNLEFTVETTESITPNTCPFCASDLEFDADAWDFDEDEDFFDD